MAEAADTSAVNDAAPEFAVAEQVERAVDLQNAQNLETSACPLLSKVYGLHSHPEAHLADGCRLPLLIAACWPQDKPEACLLTRGVGT
jgi:hypothetical protein